MGTHTNSGCTNSGRGTVTGQGRGIGGEGMGKGPDYSIAGGVVTPLVFPSLYACNTGCVIWTDREEPLGQGPLGKGRKCVCVCVGGTSRKCLYMAISP